jgi:uncharacterized protein YbbC (DUF1343 family)/CubicO group peptidase (beta-lactamase class C family)
MRARLRIWFLLLLAACATAQQHPSAFDLAKLREIDATIEKAIADKRTPGGVLWIEQEGSVHRRTYGNRALVPAAEATTEDTIYDAASITKVVATAPSIWLLVERGAIEIDAAVKTYLAEYPHGEVTVRHLLTHTSGLRPGISLAEPWRGYDEGVRRAIAEEPRNRPGAIFRYSDVNYILLGEIVRRVSGQPLNEFARKNIFDPLAMTDTGFLPAPSPRIAPTQYSEDAGLLRGVVHDPTSRRMGGVAGHAGLFTTASDLAKFARAVLRGDFFPAAMTEVQTPPGVAVQRAGGFDIDSSYSKARGEFRVGSFGHTGWTGGFMWIDPSSRTFYIFVSNRVHPEGRGNVVPLQRALGTLVSQAAGVTGTPPPRVRYVVGGADVQNGIDVLAVTNYEALRGLRIGLITNHTGIDRAGNPTIDLLRSAPGVNLVALFSPEHGIRGALDANVPDDRDAITGLPIYSLYGERRQPSPEQIAILDALVFDIQDVGARFYTYISTLGMAMEALSGTGKKMIVLDRVNPIDGVTVEGPLLEGKTDFVAYHDLVVRHGMTVGELARMFREEKKLEVDLTVIQLRGWKRTMYQDEAGLPWINTSPNMRSLTEATLYPGIGLLESALSVGRGTATPFEVIGAPYIDGEVLAREMASLNLPGIAFTPIRFTPDASIHKDQPCGGLRLTVTDRKALRPVDVGISLATVLYRLYPTHFDPEKMHRLLRHRPTLEAIKANKPLGEIRSLWGSEFEVRRTRHLLY